VLPALGRLGVTGLQVAPPSLEELFLRHYGDVLEPQEA
jgi:ABC-2 type transport system ATP-binding protein